jgi:addiction module HigA family antidote
MPKTAKTPGSVLQSYLDEYQVSAAAVAKELKVKGLGSVLSDKRGIDIDLAMRLAKYFGTTPDFWINLQLSCYKKTLTAEIKNISKAKKPSAKKAADKKPGARGRKPADSKAAADKKPGTRGRKPADSKTARAAKEPKERKPRAPRGSKKSAAFLSAQDTSFDSSGADSEFLE